MTPSRNENHPNGVEWNARGNGLRVGWPMPAVASEAWPAERLFTDLRLAVEIDGQWREPDRWAIAPDGAGTATVAGIRVRLSLRPAGPGRRHHELQARIENVSGAAIRFGGFRFQQQRAPSDVMDDFLAIPGPRLRLYREGWTAAAAAGTVRYGECDFDLDPSYLPFAVSAPAAYDSATPNRFSAEYAVVLNDRVSGASLLAGFISSADQVTRLAVELDDAGVARFAAYAYADGILVEPGEIVDAEVLAILAGPDGYGLLEEFATLWGARMRARIWGHTPSGWCSWYYYFEKITDADVHENLRLIQERRAELPLEYVQIDDGFQPALGDWLEPSPQFPNGPETLARDIREAGCKPGLWLAPFMVEERSHFYAAHPEWMVKTPAGQTAWVTNWRGSRVAVLDCTRPEAQAWLRALFATLAAWGYDYIKLDFLMYECAVPGGVYWDPKATRAQACRRGLQAIRDGFGEERFILGGTTLLGPAVGIVDGERIGTDITPYWKPDRHPLPKEAPCLPNVCRNIINRRYMHGRLWLNDPDVHLARADHNALTENEVRLWTAALWLVGGLTLLSDRFATLAPEREKWSRWLVADRDGFDTRPLDFFEREFPAIWLGRRRSQAPMDQTCVLGLFNFADSATTLRVPLSQAGFAPGATVDLHDVWTDGGRGRAVTAVEQSLPPHSCALLRLTPACPV